MPPKKAPKHLAEQATRIVGRLSADKRAELASVATEVKEELQDRLKKPSPARIALAKLKLAPCVKGSAWVRFPSGRASNAGISAGSRTAWTMLNSTRWRDLPMRSGMTSWWT